MIDGKNKNVGLEIFFKDESKHIILRKASYSFFKAVFKDDRFWQAVFNTSQEIKTVKVGGNLKFKGDDCRQIYFYDTKGEELAKWKDTDGK